MRQARAHGSWGGPMGMSTEAQTGPLNCLGMGGTWAHVGNVYRRANWTAKVQAGMCTRVAHVVSFTLFLPDWCDQTDRTEACMGRWQLLIAWACETVGMEKSLDVTDGSVVRAWDCFACSSVRLRARLRSAPSALRRAALVRVVCDHGRDGRACIGRLRVCALRIGRLRVCLRSAPFALNCDCRSFALLPMQLCLYMLSVRYLR